MFADYPPMINIPVRDVAAAKMFYEETLGIDVSADEHGAVYLEAGGVLMMVYESEYAGSNQGTLMTFVLGDDFGAALKRLRARNVSLLTYDLPDVTVENGVHELDDVLAIWFKDPSGNIISVTNQ